MTDQEIFDIARVARVADKTDTVESVSHWRRNSLHPVTKLLRIRFGVDICTPESVWYPPARFGIVHLCFNSLGGTETWAKNFLRHVGDCAGIATLDRPLGEVACPIYHGDAAVHAMCRAAETVLVWGVTDVHKHLFESPRPKRLIAVHHGALNSRWACDTFENQLSWCDGGVAVNEDVAARYGVPCIPNIVAPLEYTGFPLTGTYYDDLYSYVLWLHRPSAEKRPEFALEIAKHLPDRWKMVGTFGEMQVPENVINLKAVTDPNHKYHLFGLASVFLATPTDEGFGYSVAEAVEQGVPVVSTPHGIAKKVATGLLEDTAGPAEFARVIQWAAKRMQVETQEKRDYLMSKYGPNAIVPLWRSL